MNPTPPFESFSFQTNWYANTVWAGDAYGVSHYTPWLDSSQGWSAGSANNGTDYLQYDLKVLVGCKALLLKEEQIWLNGLLMLKWKLVLTIPIGRLLPLT